jgi:5-methylcytosine-specific restriction endonuclease McrA
MTTLRCLDKDTLLEVLNAIRKSFTKNSPEYAAILNKSLAKAVGPKGGARYHCAKCKNVFQRKEVQIDHISPMIPVGVSPVNMTLEEVYRRCWVLSGQLQVLCKECHSAKSKIENKARREIKKLSLTNL